jgi:sulfhydrogenase subunit beta (sulfur reductase)
MTKTSKENAKYVLERQDFQTLLDVLTEKGYRLIGPTPRDGAVIYDEIATVNDLPIGMTDEQERGMYRLKPGDPGRLFGYGVGPHSWKKVLYPAQLRLWQANRQNGGMTIEPEAHTPERLALIGVRACELHALGILDKVLSGGAYRDTVYEAQRQNVFIVAVNCGRAGNTCFCASMNAGPRVESGFDLALTEVLDLERHYFVIEAGSSAGKDALAALPVRHAEIGEIQCAALIIEQTAANMGRTLDTRGLKDLLFANIDHPEWDDVAARCMTCGNCTLVCPTCFCTTVEDVAELTGERAFRIRRWDSCFTMDFSYIVGGHIRASSRSRYRQWMMHKLSTWVDQFGSMGCVGCGRCITWCPVGIDITEQARTIRAESQVKTETGSRRRKQHENA